MSEPPQGMQARDALSDCPQDRPQSAPDRDRLFMQAALDEARRAYAKGEVPVGAVAVYQDQIIARGHNCKESERDPTAHAEIIALREAARIRGGWRLTGVTLYCTLEPCPMCAGAMVQARLPRLVYAIDDPKVGAAGSIVDLVQNPQLNHQIEVTRGVMGREAESLLEAFFVALRRGEIARYSKPAGRPGHGKSASCGK
jgi:tRNA(adenine34) deaminase